MSWATKIGGAVIVAIVLAVVGATAGTGPSASSETATAAPNAQPAPSPTLAAPPEPVVNPRAADAGLETSSGIATDGRIILNVANEDELTKLPGIGPSRARAIVTLRQRLARFRAVEDLLRVKGIGRKTLRRIKPMVVLDRPPAGDGGLAAENHATE
jgi:competence protein ComEA